METPKIHSKTRSQNRRKKYETLENGDQNEKRESINYISNKVISPNVLSNEQTDGQTHTNTHI